MATPPESSKKTVDQEHQEAKEGKVLEDPSKELISNMATPPESSKKTVDQEHPESSLADSSKELVNKMATPPESSKKTVDQEHQEAKEGKVLEDSSKELVNKMATPPESGKKTVDQKHPESSLADSSKELKSIMATPPKGDQKPNDQEHQKAKEGSSTEIKLLPCRLDVSSQVSHGPASQEADIPASQEIRTDLPVPHQEPVPEGDKLERAPKSLLKGDPQTVSSLLSQLPKKLRRLLSRQIHKGAHVTVKRIWRQGSPTSLQAPPAQEISGRGRQLYRVHRKHRVIINHRRMMPNSCLYCRRILRPYSCILTTIMPHLKIVGKKHGYSILQHHLNRNFQSQPGVHNQRRRGILVGTQVKINSSSLTNPGKWRTSLGRNYWSPSNEEEKGFTLIYESNGLKGPFHCPRCSETYSHAGDFLAHLKKHSGIKVTIMVDKPDVHLCPYCERTFDTPEAILSHWCPCQ